MSLSVFALSPAVLEILASTTPRPEEQPPEGPSAPIPRAEIDRVCPTCRGMAFRTAEQKRAHLRSDLHVHRLRTRIHGDIRLSSASDTDGTRSEPSDGTESDTSSGSASSVHSEATPDPGTEPLLWLTATAEVPPIHHGDRLGIYQALFGNRRRGHYSRTADPKPIGYPADPLDPATEGPLAILAALQRPANLPPLPSPAQGGDVEARAGASAWHHRWWTVVLISGGRFAGAVFDNHTGTMRHHKTIQRYTTRRKQGGAQSKNDRAKGAAHSAGASLRRHNQAALEREVRDILERRWRPWVAHSSHIFAAVPRSERRTYLADPDLFDFTANVHSVPFATARPTLEAVERVYARLTAVRHRAGGEDAATALRRLNIAPVETAPARPARDDTPADVSPGFRLSPARSRHLLALLAADRETTFLSYVRRRAVNLNDALSVGPDPTLLHAAAARGSPAWATLLLREGADPTLTGPAGSVQAYDVCPDDATRVAFVQFRQRRPGQWPWDTTTVPAALEYQPPSVPPTNPPSVSTRAEPSRVPARAFAGPLPNAPLVAPPHPVTIRAPPVLPSAAPMTAPVLPTTTIRPAVAAPIPPPVASRSRPRKPRTIASQTTTAFRPGPSTVGWGVLGTLPSYLAEVAPTEKRVKSDRELRAEAAERRLRQSRGE
ncbi:hypothetical protein IWQ60_012214 [Tieghemiomyces parasiticus]|uniref:VLRF1 domain-containing protein n=1 Tax=Tieghemiomyces parasiticus TaxID=78921 RepID=A0A9W8DGM2_9FUNG|nr:hypothetical protein IWQ60_012214 [Tieghemiomyces parasiticus]